MASEFDMEVFRTILTNLGDRLSNTRGDEQNADRLRRVEAAIKNLEKSINAKKAPDFNAKKVADELSKVVSTEGISKEVAASIEKGFKTVSENKEGYDGSGIADIAKNLPDAGGKLTTVLGKVSAGFAGFTTATGKISESLARVTANMDGSFTGFSRSLGLTTGSFAVFASFLDDNVNAYRDLQTASEGSIGSITDMRKAMSTAAMGAGEFAKAIKDGTDGTRLIGGQNWANLYKSIKEQTYSMGNFGYSLQGLAKAQNDYLGILVDRGDIQRLNGDQQAAGFKSLLDVNSRVATILGKDRDDMLKRIAKENEDANLNTYLQALNLSPDQRTEVDAIMAVASQLGPQFQSAVKELIMYEGGVRSQDSLIATLPPEVVSNLQQITAAIRSGNINKGAAVQFTQDIKRDFAAGDATRDNKTMAQLGGIIGGQFEAGNIARIAASNLRTVDDKTTFAPDQTDDATTSLLQFEKIFKDTAAMQQDIYNTMLYPAMREFGSTMKDVTMSVGEQGGFIDNLRSSIKTIDDFTTALKIAGGLLAGGVVINGATMLLSAAFGASLGPIFNGLSKTLNISTQGFVNATKSFSSWLTNGGAKGAVEGVAKGASGAAQGAKTVAKAVVEQTPGLLNSPVAKRLTKALGPLAVILEGLDTYGDIVADYDRKEKGEITGEEFKKLMSKHIGGGLGGLSGAYVGGQLLGAMGAAGGSVVPGLGTVAGGVIGGIGGGIGGYYAGDAMGEEIGALIYDNLLANAEADGTETPEITTPVVAAEPEILTPTPVIPEIPQIGSLDTVVTKIEETNTALNETLNLLRSLIDITKEDTSRVVEPLEKLLTAQEDLVRKFRLGSL